MSVALFLFVCFLAWSNGANDNFKGVASLYGSRKTGLPHVPVAAEGWDLAAGSTPRQALIQGVPRGALVDRLSMGRPAANGDFSGVIKNSFAIAGGELGMALSETMISGNVAQMLRDVVAVSAERIDTGGWVLPWLPRME